MKITTEIENYGEKKHVFFFHYCFRNNVTMPKNRPKLNFIIVSVEIFNL